MVNFFEPSFFETEFGNDEEINKMLGVVISPPQSTLCLGYCTEKMIPYHLFPLTDHQKHL